MCCYSPTLLLSSLLFSFRTRFFLVFCAIVAVFGSVASVVIVSPSSALSFPFSFSLFVQDRARVPDDSSIVIDLFSFLRHDRSVETYREKVLLPVPRSLRRTIGRICGEASSPSDRNAARSEQQLGVTWKSNVLSPSVANQCPCLCSVKRRESKWCVLPELCFPFE